MALNKHLSKRNKHLLRNVHLSNTCPGDSGNVYVAGRFWYELKNANSFGLWQGGPNPGGPHDIVGTPSGGVLSIGHNRYRRFYSSRGRSFSFDQTTEIMALCDGDAEGSIMVAGSFASIGAGDTEKAAINVAEWNPKTEEWTARNLGKLNNAGSYDYGPKSFVSHLFRDGTNVYAVLHEQWWPTDEDVLHYWNSTAANLLTKWPQHGHCQLWRWNGSSWNQLGTLSTYIIQNNGRGSQDATTDRTAGMAAVEHTYHYNPAPWFNSLESRRLWPCTVRAITKWDSSIVFAGCFNRIDTTVADNIAVWNGSTLTALGTDDFKPRAPFDAADPRSDNQETWVGSQYSTGVHKSYSITSGLGDHSGGVYALAVYDGDLIVGGDFEEPFAHIMKRSGSAWAPLTVGSGASAPVYALHTHEVDTKLYVTGKFEKINGRQVWGIATWDGNQYAPVINPNPGPDRNHPSSEPTFRKNSFIRKIVSYQDFLLFGISQPDFRGLYRYPPTHFEIIQYRSAHAYDQLLTVECFDIYLGPSTQGMANG